MRFQDFGKYYTILNLSRNCSRADLKKTYFKLAATYHPDRNKSPGAEAKFKEICEAYEQLDKYHLSGDEFEKRRADNIAENKQKWQRRRQQRGYRKSGFRTSPGMQPPYLSYAIIGLTLAGIGLFYATEGARLRYRFIRDVYGPTVSAWFNPETNRWETPAPWDPLYGENLSSLARVDKKQVHVRFPPDKSADSSGSRI